MRLGHIIVSVHKKLHLLNSVLRARVIVLRTSYCIVNNASGHSGEVIPVPIPNTEVKLSYVDDTGFVPGK